MELVFWAVDKNDPATEPARGVGGYFAGDIIQAFPDGVLEKYPLVMNEPRWRILRVSGLTKSEVDALTAITDYEGDSPRDYIHKRHHRIDLDALETELRKKLISDPNGIHDIHIAKFRALMKAKNGRPSKARKEFK